MGPAHVEAYLFCHKLSGPSSGGFFYYCYYSQRVELGVLLPFSVLFDSFGLDNGEFARTSPVLGSSKLRHDVENLAVEANV
jgi:hypothetical protein